MCTLIKCSYIWELQLHPLSSRWRMNRTFIFLGIFSATAVKHEHESWTIVCSCSIFCELDGRVSFCERRVAPLQTTSFVKIKSHC